MVYDNRFPMIPPQQVETPWMRAQKNLMPTYDVFQQLPYNQSPYGSAPEPEKVAEEAVQQAYQEVKPDGGEPSIHELRQIEAVAKRRAQNSKIYRTTGDEGFLGQVVGAIGKYIKGGGLIGAIAKGFSGKEQKINPVTGKPYGPMMHGGAHTYSAAHDAAVSDNFASATAILGVRPTGEAGGPGGYDHSTGGVFDAYGRAVDPETGEVLTNANGSRSFASFQAWMDAMAGKSPVEVRDGKIYTTAGQAAQQSDGGSGGAPMHTPDYSEAAVDAQVMGDSGGGQQGNRQGSGYGGQAQSGEMVSSDHDWSAAKNDGGLVDLNRGGDVMNTLISYRQPGGIIPGGDEADAMGTVGGIPAAEAGNPMQPPMPPVEGPQTPPQMPSQPPVAPPVKSFAEKVAEAKAAMQGGSTAVPTQPVNVLNSTDGQGDGPVQFGEGSGYPVQGAEVGPDMGPDDVDAMLAEGSYVLNAEAAQDPANQAMLDSMEAQAGVPALNYGSRPMMRAKLTRGERVMSPHVTSMFRGQLEAMNQGGLAKRAQGFNTGGGVEYLQTGTPPQYDEEYRKYAEAENRAKQLGALGSSLVSIGQRDFEGASDALNVDLLDPNKKLEKTTEQKDLAKELKSYTNISRSAQKARNLVDPARDALIEYHEAKVTANAAYATSAIIPVVNQGTEALKEVRDTAIESAMRTWGSKEENKKSYLAYTELRAALRALTAASLDTLGPGPKTDFDFKVVAESIGSLDDTPDGIKQTLQRLINNANEEITSLGGVAPKVSTDETEESLVDTPGKDKSEETNGSSTEQTEETVEYGPMSHGDTGATGVILKDTSGGDVLLSALGNNLIPDAVKLTAINTWQTANGFPDEMIVWIDEASDTIAGFKKEYGG